MKQVADEGGFKIDVATYPDVIADREFIKTNFSQTYTNRFRVAGAKLTIDGSPQGFTAWVKTIIVLWEIIQRVILGMQLLLLIKH